MKRKENWQKLLVQAIDKKKDVEFEYGANDCCLFTCDVVNEITGTDMGKKFRGYSTPAELVQVMRKYNGDVERLAHDVTSRYGLKKNQNINFAHKGDIVLMNNEGQKLMGVMYHKGMVACAGDIGMRLLPMQNAICSWRVPY